jgi:hypothetical protein
MSKFPAESAFKESLRGLRAPLLRARPHFSTVAFSAKGRKLSAATLILKAAFGGAMELAIVIVVLVVAGAMIPGNPKIRFFR